MGLQFHRGCPIRFLVDPAVYQLLETLVYLGYLLSCAFLATGERDKKGWLYREIFLFVFDILQCLVTRIAEGLACSADAIRWNFNYMPPEPLPSDRKDFFKERKHHNNNSSHHQTDRSSSESLLGGGGNGGGGSLHRWRDYSHHGREYPRFGSADFRRPPGAF